MSIKVMNFVWEHCEQKNTKLIAMLALADWSNDEGECYPGVERLAQKCRVKVRQMQTILTSLEEDGEISVMVHGGIQTPSGNTNRYYLNYYRKSIGIDPVGTPPRHAQKHTPSINGVQKNAGHGVQKNAPKPSVEPSVEPSVVATQKKSSSDDSPNQRDMYGRILELFGYERVPSSQKTTIGKVAKELREAGYTLDEVTAIYTYVKEKGFSSMTPHVLLKYAPEWNAIRISSQPPTSPLDDDDLIDIGDELDAMHAMLKAKMGKVAL